jgi:hypothetical protein
MNNENEFVNEEILNLQSGITELFKGSDENVFQYLDKKSLSLTGQQIKILLYLKSFNNPHLDKFINQYLEYKTYNKAYKILLEALRYYSLIDLIRSKVRLNLSQK